jgi:hypothetical protein
MFNLFMPKSQPIEEPKKLSVRAWLIDPVSQSITEIDTPHLPSLIDEYVGADAEPYKLDTENNVVWMSDTDSNSRYAYFWEGMVYPFDVKRYGKAIVESMGPDYWSVETIEGYLRFFDRQNIYGDV